MRDYDSNTPQGARNQSRARRLLRGRVRLELPSAPRTTFGADDRSRRQPHERGRKTYVRRIDLVSEKNPVPLMRASSGSATWVEPRSSARCVLNGTSGDGSRAALRRQLPGSDAAAIVVNESACLGLRLSRIRRESRFRAKPGAATRSRCASSSSTPMRPGLLRFLGRQTPRNGTFTHASSDYGGVEVVRASTGAGIAANPYLRFFLRAEQSWRHRVPLGTDQGNAASNARRPG